jgi:drug/metabolite transporter (DMT)-like permease
MKWRILVLLGAISFGILSTIVKLAYGNGFQVSQVVTSQLWFGAVICWSLVFIFYLLKKSMSLSLGNWWKTLIGGFPLGLTSFAYYKCVEYVPASIAILLLFQFVWMGVLFDVFLKKKIPTLAQVMSILILISGTILAAGIIDQPNPEWSIEGIGYGLLAAFGYTVFIIVNNTSGNTHFMISAALRATGGALFSILFFNPIIGLDGIFTNGMLTYGLPLAIFGMVIPPIFFAWGIPEIGTTEASIIGGVELPVAVLSASFVLNEYVSWVQWTGVALILLAITLPQLGPLLKRKAQS